MTSPLELSPHPLPLCTFFSPCSLSSEAGHKMAVSVGYFEIFAKIAEQAAIQWQLHGPTRSFLQDFLRDLSHYGSISTTDIFITLFIGVAFTILRYVFTSVIFKVSQCEQWLYVHGTSEMWGCFLYYLSFDPCALFTT